MSLMRFEGPLVSKVLRPIATTISEPIVTGTLLYILTRGPIHIRERLLQPFRTNLLAKHGVSRITALVAILKVSFVLGVVSRINKALNGLALNGWALRRQGSPFEFGPHRKELVVITGGSSGFGYEMTKAFSKVARVVVLDVNAFPLELEKLPGVYFYSLDITDNEKVQEVCADVRRVHGDPSVLVNNAGIANGKPILGTTNVETERIFKVNIISHFALVREFLPGMLQMRKGHIVTIASMLSFFSAANIVDYSCTKIAALFLSEGIRAECLSSYPGGEGICTTSVHPGWYATNIIRGAEETLDKMGVVPRPPVEVSNAVVEQVLKARSGRLVIPPQANLWTGIRSYPLWLQDIASGIGRNNNLVRIEKEASATN